MDKAAEAAKVLDELQVADPNDGPCDCNDEQCEGCFWPCEKCSSAKCGHICRVNRTWRYESWEKQGRKSDE